MSRYADFPNIWTPNEEEVILFCVRVPERFQSLSRTQYLNLMEQRLQALIAAAVDETSQLEAQRMMAVKLESFNPARDLPSLSQSDWTREWADHLIHYNETFWDRAEIGLEAFPAMPVMPESTNFRALLETHEETTLETWLNELRLI